MPITLKNSNFELTLVKAGEQYTGCRFDYNGSIIQIAYKGLNLCGKEVLDCDFDQSKNGQGLYGEFGIKNVVGYDDEDIKEGDWFPKIGTGWLKKDSKSYFFANNYEMESIDFSYEEKQNSVIFTCNSGVRNGYGYIYTKTVELLEDGFVINYSLKNTGTKAINTTEYVHNFFANDILVHNTDSVSANQGTDY